MSVLRKKDLDDFIESFNKHKEKELLIEQRVGEIINIIARVCDTELTFWEFTSGRIMCSGVFDNDEYISYVLYGVTGKILNTDRCLYGENFPKSFLFMSDDEIEKIIIAHIEETKAKAEEKKKHRKEKRKNRKAAKQAILDKLTP